MRWLQLLIASLFAFLVTRVVGSVAAPAGGVVDPPRRHMVRCASCGAYVLEDRALPAAGGAFACSSSCAGRR